MVGKEEESSKTFEYPKSGVPRSRVHSQRVSRHVLFGCKAQLPGEREKTKHKKGTSQLGVCIQHCTVNHLSRQQTPPRKKEPDKNIYSIKDQAGHMRHAPGPRNDADYGSFSECPGQQVGTQRSDRSRVESRYRTAAGLPPTANNSKPPPPAHVATNQSGVASVGGSDNPRMRAPSGAGGGAKRRRVQVHLE